MGIALMGLDYLPASVDPCLVTEKNIVGDNAAILVDQQRSEAQQRLRRLVFLKRPRNQDCSMYGILRQNLTLLQDQLASEHWSSSQTLICHPAWTWSPDRLSVGIPRLESYLSKR